MSKEIRMSGRLVFDDGTVQVSFDKGELIVNSTGKQTFQTVKSIPTTANGTALDVGSLTFPCWFICFNTDATNYVDLLRTTAVTKFGKVPARQGAGPILLTEAPYAQSNTAACLLEYVLVEE